MLVTDIIKCNKTKYLIQTNDNIQFPLYQRELNFYHLETGSEISEGNWDQILHDVLEPRAKKRALHLLEQMDRTERGLRDKLKQNDYPSCVIDAAIDYVKQFHYIDDYRYAETYVRYHQDSKSRRQLQIALMQRGVSVEVIEQALEESYSSNEHEKVRMILDKKGYSSDLDHKEKNKIYMYLMRKGYSSDIIRDCMRLEEQME